MLLSSLLHSSLETSKECDSIAFAQVSDLATDLKNLLDVISSNWNMLNQNTFEFNDLSNTLAEPLIRKVLLSVQVCETEILLPSTDALDEFSFYPDYLRKQGKFQ